jgi:hypothetical protein
VVAFDPVVRVLVGVVERDGQDVLDDAFESRCQVRHNLRGRPVSAQRGGEEAPCRADVAPRREVHVDDLAVLVHRAIPIAPDPGDLHLGLVDEPSVAHGVAPRSGRVDQHRREALHPPQQRHVIDLDTALSEELLEVPVTTARTGDTSAPPT